MTKNLVIVESPAKAKTIEGFLGKDFTVKSSYGHVRDLKKNNLSIDVDNGFLPDYEVSDDKKDIVKELKKLAKGADTVWLATDEDREGEAISWHLKEALGLDDAKTKRITFNEITKNAILKAVENPRLIDINLVDAQQARRILDRLVGFELSPVLWKKVKPSLSAGRVQSVAVRLIVDREKEIKKFISEGYFKITGEFLTAKNEKLKAEIQSKIKDDKKAEEILESCSKANFTIKSIETKPGKKTPAAPFTTSTLQQEASRKLGFSVSRTMRVAQQLYEAGKITYMRTDSVNISKDATAAAKKTITEMYGEQYSNPKQYKGKIKGAQEAHEAIRPTYMENSTTTGDDSQQRLYDLIWKRTLASQMADAKFEKTTAKIALSNSPELFTAVGEVLKFDGFLKVYLESTDDENEEQETGLLPAIAEGEELSVDSVVGRERFTHHPARFTEASLVKRLEEQGIGRPSTYAPTISTIQKREYVVKEDREGVQRAYKLYTLKQGKISKEEKLENTGAEKSKLFPTDIGVVVNDFLVEHFEGIMDYNFTASVEKEFDEIASGHLVWNNMIKKFYSPFHQGVEITLETSEKVTGERELGLDPETGKKIITRIGRFGPMVQIGEAEGEEKPKFASLRKNQSISTITLEEALDLFKLPRTIGNYEDLEVIVSVGKFGPYIRHNSKFVSINTKEGDDPLTIELDRAIELIEEKRKIERERVIKTFPENEEVQILKGRWGPYISVGKKNIKIPKDKSPETLTLEECLTLAENAPVKKARGAKKKA